MKVTINRKAFEVYEQPADYWQWVAKGNYDREWNVYDRYLRPEHTFLDLGAWVGSHSLYAARTARKIIALEPDPVAFAILEKNLPPAVERYRGAISDKPGLVTLGSGCLGASTTRFNLSAGSGIGSAEGLESCTAEGCPLPAFAFAYPDPLFIKIDVEGAEELIFREYEFFKDRKPTVLVELHPWWWIDQDRAAREFEVIKDLYCTVNQFQSGAYLLTDAK